jgi:uncharacterized protein YdaT
MTWELYEVWAEDGDGHEKLVETTKSRKQAIDIARDCIKDGYFTARVLQEVGEEEMELVQTFKG